jgi:hypothetical protein
MRGRSEETRGSHEADRETASFTADAGFGGGSNTKGGRMKRERRDRRDRREGDDEGDVRSRVPFSKPARVWA